MNFYLKKTRMLKKSNAFYKILTQDIGIHQYLEKNDNLVYMIK